MKLFRRVKKMIQKNSNKTLSEWRAKLDEAKGQYSTERKAMNTYSKYYKGDREIARSVNNESVTDVKKAANVRNIVYELVESQVDSSIPMPKVRAIHAEDDMLAVRIEKLLENMVQNLKLQVLNDEMERVTYVQGGSLFHVQWDTNKGLHSEVGAVVVDDIHPYNVIPQPGVLKLEDMDYFFIQQTMTKRAVKRFYGVDVSEASNDDMEASKDNENANINDEIVTVNTCYFKNDDGGVGKYVWCDVYELQNFKDYQARQRDVCDECGTTMINGVCPVCGSRKKKKVTDDYEDIVEGYEINIDGTERKANLDPMDESSDLYEDGPEFDENGNPVLNEEGIPTIKRIKKKIPYYKPNIYPVVLRKNISEEDRFLGGSDVRVMMDQQDAIKKYATKIDEKLMKAGSALTLPEGLSVETTDKEFKIIRVRNAADVSMINVLNLQANVQYDTQMLDVNYEAARSTIGITDSYQGKYDSSATSGTAKQFSINQAAGRLESKRTMKNEAFARLYEIMFKFWLAYADQTTAVTTMDASGVAEHDMIDRHEFLKMDAAGEFYWNDEFIFDTDPTSTLMANREAMWNQTDLKLQSQAFGPLGDLNTLKTYWTFMKANGYPNAGLALDSVLERIQTIEEQQQMQEQMQQEQALAAQTPDNLVQGIPQ
jgi:hypothetical protein